MAPPPQPIHKQEHHGLLSVHHAHSAEDSEKCIPCSQCRYPLHSDAKFCMMCGAERPKVRPPGVKKLSALEEDCVHTDGCRRAAWLFLHTEVKDKPCILRHARKYEMFTICLVLYLVVADIVGSIPEVAKVFRKSVIIQRLEAGIYVVFTLEYTVRLWSCMESKALASLGSIKGRLKLMRGVIEMVDLVVLVAYYIMFIPGFDKVKGFSALRMIRLLRVAALLKMERKASSFSKIVCVLKTKKSELMATLFTAAVLMLMSATTMYYLENEAQPDGFSSVPDAMWWSVTALTTVGYGDVVPVTPAGKVLGSIVAFFGVGLFALPAGILGSGFVEEVDKAKKLAQQELEESEGEVVDEMLGEQAEEANMISKLTDDVKELRGTVDGLLGGQRDINNLLNDICPSLGIGRSVSPSKSLSPRKRIPHDAVHRQVTDYHLAALQESVNLKLDSLRRSRTLGNQT